MSSPLPPLGPPAYETGGGRGGLTIKWINFMVPDSKTDNILILPSHELANK